MSGAEELRMAERRNLIARVQPVEMRDMAVLVFRIVTVLQPFLQLTVATYLHGRQQSELLLCLVAECRVGTEYF